MVDSLFKIIEWIFPWAKDKIISPLKVDVINLYLQDMLNGSVDSLLIVTPYTYRYYATLQLTNNQNMDIYVKQIKLIINETEKHETKEKMPIHLRPRQFVECNIIFPIEKEQAVKSGNFIIEITPSLGRKAITSGSFPLKN